MTNERNKLIKSLRAKINFGHPIYLWELLLFVKYALQERNICFINQFKSHLKFPPVMPLGICGTLSSTLSVLYTLQTVKKTTPPSITKIILNAVLDRHTIMRLLAKVYAETYNTIPPRLNQNWFAKRKDRLKFLDIVIEKFKDSKECYILRGQLTMGDLHPSYYR